MKVDERVPQFRIVKIEQRDNLISLEQHTVAVQIRMCKSKTRHIEYGPVLQSDIPTHLSNRLDSYTLWPRTSGPVNHRTVLRLVEVRNIVIVIARHRARALVAQVHG